MASCLSSPRERGVDPRAVRVRWTVGLPAVLLAGRMARAPAGCYDVFNMGGVLLVELGHHVVEFRTIARDVTQPRLVPG
jgi:hypothetical protein